MYIEYFMQSITESRVNWLFTKIITCKHYSKCHFFMFYNKQVDTLDSREYETKKQNIVHIVKIRFLEVINTCK